MLQRRAILAALTTSLAAIIAPTGAIAAESWTASSTSLREQLQRLLGREFQLDTETGATCRARLIAVDEGPECRELEQFSIVFDGVGLSDGIHDAFHPDIGKIPISLFSSVCEDSNRVRKRAYFSMFSDGLSGWCS
jgi:hypothetical protein